MVKYLAVVFVCLVGCGGEENSNTPSGDTVPDKVVPKTCDVGALDCACFGNATCSNGLGCNTAGKCEVSTLTKVVGTQVCFGRVKKLTTLSAPEWDYTLNFDLKNEGTQAGKFFISVRFHNAFGSKGAILDGAVLNINSLGEMAVEQTFVGPYSETVDFFIKTIREEGSEPFEIAYFGVIAIPDPVGSPDGDNSICVQ